MKKQFAKVIFASILTITSFYTAFGQNTDTTRFDQTNRTMPLIDVSLRFDRTESLFTGVITEAAAQLGEERVVQITSAGIGVPTETIEQDIVISGAPLDTVVMSEIVAQSTGAPVEIVVEEFQDGNSLQEVVDTFNGSSRSILLRFDSFIDIFTEEVGVQSGILVINFQFAADELNRNILVINNRFNRFPSKVGQMQFETLVIQRLAFETGMSIDQINAIRSTLPTTTSLGDLAVSLIVADSLDASITTGFNFRQELLNSAFILETLNLNKIPSPVIADRISIFQKDVRAIVFDVQ